jgi:hypothetical protein
MRPVKLSVLLVTIAWFASACSPLLSVPEATATSQPTVEVTPFQFPTLTPYPTPLPPSPTTVTIPAWITDFSDPVLKAVSERRPDYQDEFSPYNQGWFTVNSDNRQRPFFALVKEGTLFLELPEGKARKELTVYNPKLLFRDFVLSFDFKFGKTEPDDILRFQYIQTTNQSAMVDLSKNESWTFYWNLHNDLQSTRGSYDYFSPEYLNATIIMQGDQCAIYLNHDPVDYLDNCRIEPISKPALLTMTFHLLGTGYPAEVMIDHLKIWDLEKIPNLP